MPAAKTTPARDVAAEIAFLTRALKAPTLRESVDRLAERFPAVPKDRITDLVHARHLDYTGAPVRDFIPVLIEHDVKRELLSEVGPQA